MRKSRRARKVNGAIIRDASRLLKRVWEVLAWRALFQKSQQVLYGTGPDARTKGFQAAGLGRRTMHHEPDDPSCLDRSAEPLQWPRVLEGGRLRRFRLNKHQIARLCRRQEVHFEPL